MNNSFSNISLILKHSVLKYYCYLVLPTYIRVKLTLKNHKLELSVCTYRESRVRKENCLEGSVLGGRSKFCVETKPWVEAWVTCFETMNEE